MNETKRRDNRMGKEEKLRLKSLVDGKRRRAVDRVLLRRRIREAYRLNRHGLREAIIAHGGIRTLGMAFVYIHDDNADYSLIEKKMRRLMDKLARIIEDQKPEHGCAEEKKDENSSD